MKMSKKMSKKVVEKMLKSDYEGFVQLMDGVNNVVDAYVEADDTLNEGIASCRNKKKGLDASVKAFKLVGEGLRENLLRYILDKGVERLYGVKAKSVTFQPEKEVVETVAKRQIMVGRQYEDLDSLSKEDLVEMLESKGVKCREVSSIIKTIKSASIRVLR